MSNEKQGPVKVRAVLPIGNEKARIFYNVSFVPNWVEGILLPIAPDGSVCGLERWMVREPTQEEWNRLEDEWLAEEEGNDEFSQWLDDKRDTAIQAILDTVKEPTP